MTRIRSLTTALAVAVAAWAATPALAVADFSITSAGGAVTSSDGSRNAQAGAHADFTTKFDLSTVDVNGAPHADGNLKDIVAEIPPGVLGNPRVAPTCTVEDLGKGFFENPECPAEAQVGVADVTVSLNNFPITVPWPVYNMEPRPGQPARLGFNVLGVLILMDPELRPDDYGLTVRSHNISQSLATIASRVTLWGTPADPANDDMRFETNPYRVPPQSSGLPRRPFMSAPTRCAGPQTTTIRARSWQAQEQWSTVAFDSDFNGDPLQAENCPMLPFEPTVDVALDSGTADSPSGLRFGLDVPQDGLEDPGTLATAHLKDVSVTLPEGVTINPGSADGLAACSDGQLGLGTNDPVGCPAASRIGTVTAHTPLLDETLEGAVYLRSQASTDPESGDMYRLALVIRNDERGIMVKLPGSVRADSRTGRLTATFRDNPQLPVSRLDLQLKPGVRAPLATPLECGARIVETGLASWGGQSVQRQMPLAGDCQSGGFAPALEAGSTDPVAGAFSPFVVRIERDDRQAYLGGVSIDMPGGVLAKLRGVPLCGDAAAAAGTCAAASRVGSATVGAGPGSNPFYLKDQPVYLGGPYKGAPYSLAVVARAVAGPFDLGTVVVRQALHVDRDDAHVTVVSDPLPTIVGGVPLRLRTIDVAIDRPEFTLNPTSCADLRVEAKLGATTGAVHQTDNRFRVADCAALPFGPKLGLRLTGRKQTTTGRHPGVRARVTQRGVGGAAISRARVVLPPSLALDPDNANALCEFVDGTKPDLESHCPKGSIVGRARAVSPLLNRPLTGDVFFVKNVRVDRKTGNRLRTLPMIVVALRGEIAINLVGKSSTAKDGRLVNTFATVPDAPVTRFDLSIAGGDSGILAVTATRKGKIDLCAKPDSHLAAVRMDGHNGKRASFATRAKAPCAKRRR